VEDYRKSFEQLVYHIRLYDKTISKTFLISQFVLGLKDELRAAVELQIPNTLGKAATLAAIQEGLVLRQKKPYYKHATPRSPSSSKADSPTQPPTGDLWKARHLWKARQLKEFRRLNGLYFQVW
jgi:hypothetical protein